MEAASAVHVLIMANARPSMEIMEKLRLSSCLWPITSAVRARRFRSMDWRCCRGGACLPVSVPWRDV